MSFKNFVYENVVKKLFSAEIENEINVRCNIAAEVERERLDNVHENSEFIKKSTWIGKPVISFSAEAGSAFEKNFLEIGFITDVCAEGNTPGGLIYGDFYNPNYLSVYKKEEPAAEPKAVYSKLQLLTGHSLLVLLRMNLAQLYMHRYHREAYEPVYHSIHPGSVNPYINLPYEIILQEVREYAASVYSDYKASKAIQPNISIGELEDKFQLYDGQREAMLALAQEFLSSSLNKTQVTDLYRAIYGYNRQALVDLTQSPTDREAFILTNQYCACVQLALYVMTRNNVLVHQG